MAEEEAEVGAVLLVDAVEEAPAVEAEAVAPLPRAMAADLKAAQEAVVLASSVLMQLRDYSQLSVGATKDGGAYKTDPSWQFSSEMSEKLRSAMVRVSVSYAGTLECESAH